MEPDDGMATAGLMRKVLGQDKRSDKGPTEKVLRKWLDKDPRGFTETIDRKAKGEGEARELTRHVAGLEAENAELQKALAERDQELAALRGAAARPGEPDEGTAKARALIKKISKEIEDGAHS